MDSPLSAGGVPLLAGAALAAGPGAPDLAREMPEGRPRRGKETEEADRVTHL